MKKKRTLIMGCGILFVLTVILLWMKYAASKAAAAEAPSIAVTDLDSEKISKLRLRINGEEEVFIKSAGAWKRAGDDAFPADSNKIQHLAEALAALRAQREIGGESSGLEEYGLKEAVNQICLTMEDSTEVTIYVGDRNEIQDMTYVYLNEASDRIYMTDTDVAALIPEALVDWAESESPPVIAQEAIVQIEVVKEGGYSLEKDEDTEWWDVRNISEDKDESIITLHRADTSLVQTLTADISGLTFLSLVEYGGANMAFYGLENPAAELRIHYRADSDAEVESPGTESVAALYIGGQSEDGSYYVRTEGSGQVHTISESVIESFLEKTPEACWSLAVMPLEIEDILSLDVTIGNQTGIIERQREEVKDDEGEIVEKISYRINGEAMERSGAEALITELLSVEAQSKSMDYTNENEPELTVTFHTEDGDYMSTYCDYDSSFYYVKDSEGVPSLVSRNTVKALLQSCQEHIGS